MSIADNTDENDEAPHIFFRTHAGWWFQLRKQCWEKGGLGELHGYQHGRYSDLTGLTSPPLEGHELLTWSAAQGHKSWHGQVCGSTGWHGQPSPKSWHGWLLIFPFWSTRGPHGWPYGVQGYKAVCARPQVCWSQGVLQLLGAAIGSSSSARLLDRCTRL